jgi:hypothetical protein
MKPPLAGLLRAVAEHGIHAHHRLLVHQRSGFGDRAFARVEFDLDELHVRAEDLVVDLVGALQRACRRRRRRRHRVRTRHRSSVHLAIGIHSAKPWRQQWPLGFCVACATAAA